jgi:hypothetical protein
MLPFQGATWVRRIFSPKALPLGYNILRFQREFFAKILR